MLKKLGEKILSPFKDGNAESGCCDNNTYNYGETVEVKISCLSHEPKLEKPTEFLSSDFAGIIRSHCNGVEIKHHSSYEKDIFQAEISRMHLDGKWQYTKSFLVVHKEGILGHNNCI